MMSNLEQASVLPPCDDAAPKLNGKKSYIEHPLRFGVQSPLGPPAATKENPASPTCVQSFVHDGNLQDFQKHSRNGVTRSAQFPAPLLWSPAIARTGEGPTSAKDRGTDGIPQLQLRPLTVSSSSPHQGYLSRVEPEESISMIATSSEREECEFVTKTEKEGSKENMSQQQLDPYTLPTTTSCAVDHDDADNMISSAGFGTVWPNNDVCEKKDDVVADGDDDDPFPIEPMKHPDTEDDEEEFCNFLSVWHSANSSQSRNCDENPNRSLITSPSATMDVTPQSFPPLVPAAHNYAPTTVSSAVSPSSGTKGDSISGGGDSSGSRSKKKALDHDVQTEGKDKQEEERNKRQRRVEYALSVLTNPNKSETDRILRLGVQEATRRRDKAVFLSLLGGRHNENKAVLSESCGGTIAATATTTTLAGTTATFLSEAEVGALLPVSVSSCPSPSSCTKQSENSPSSPLNLPVKNEPETSSSTVSAKKKRKGKEMGSAEKKSKGKETFPQRLMDIVSAEDNQHAVAWLPNGEAFAVLNREAFVTDVLPRSFGNGAVVQFRSFTRKLNRWGFERILFKQRTKKNHFVYHHKLFRRDYPQLCMEMKRLD